MHAHEKKAAEGGSHGLVKGANNRRGVVSSEEEREEGGDPLRL